MNNLRIKYCTKRTSVTCSSHRSLSLLIMSSFFDMLKKTIFDHVFLNDHTDVVSVKGMQRFKVAKTRLVTVQTFVKLQDCKAYLHYLEVVFICSYLPLYIMQPLQGLFMDACQFSGGDGKSTTVEKKQRYVSGEWIENCKNYA